MPPAAAVCGEQVSGVEVTEPAATSETVQETDPAGAVAPAAPVTVAVKTIVSPNTGATTGALITSDGVATPITTSSGGVEVSAEK